MHKPLSLAVVGTLLALTAGTLALAGDVSGSWSLVIQTPGGNGTSSLKLTQNGSLLSGEYKGQFGDAPVTGTLTRDEIELQYSIGDQNEPMVVKYVGKVSGNTMSGKILLGQFGEGSFSGTKQ